MSADYQSAIRSAARVLFPADEDQQRSESVTNALRTLWNHGFDNGWYGALDEWEKSHDDGSA